MTKFSRLLVLLIVASPACVPTGTDPDGQDAIIHGTSFGMCQGYCTSVLEIDGTIVTLTETSRDSMTFPRRMRVLQLTQEEARRLHELVDTQELSSVAGTHGCPDCADGGAEWIAIEVENKTIRTTYEYGSPPETIADLQAELRALRQRIE